MKIRAATEADIPRIMPLARAMVDESRFAIYGMNLQKSQDAIAMMVRHPASACMLLAERSNGDIAGMLAGYVTELFFADARVAQDRWFYVAPPHRGSAAALKLLITFRRWAEARQANELWLNMSVGIDMARFNRFMAHLKFTCCGSNFYMSLSTPAESIGATDAGCLADGRNGTMRQRQFPG